MRHSAGERIEGTLGEQQLNKRQSTVERTTALWIFLQELLETPASLSLIVHLHLAHLQDIGRFSELLLFHQQGDLGQGDRLICVLGFLNHFLQNASSSIVLERFSLSLSRFWVCRSVCLLHLSRVDGEQCFVHLHDLLLKGVQLRFGFRCCRCLQSFSRVEEILIAIENGEIVRSHGNDCQIRRSNIERTLRLSTTKKKSFSTWISKHRCTRSMLRHSSPAVEENKPTEL